MASSLASRGIAGIFYILFSLRKKAKKDYNDPSFCVSKSTYQKIVKNLIFLILKYLKIGRTKQIFVNYTILLKKKKAADTFI